jgi:hypothetical protein
MMRLNFLLISLAFAFSIHFAEAADSYTKIYYGKRGMYGTAILGLPNGELALAGISYEHTYYAVFAKFNADGEALFQKTYESKNDRFHIQIESMAQASDGGYFLAGHMCPGVCTDAIVIRVNESGKIIWTKSFGTKLIDYFTSIVATPDGGFALSVVSGVDRGFTSYRALVIRANGEGKVAWSKLFEPSSEVAEIYPLPSIAISPNGGFLFVSEAEFEDEHYGLLLVRFDGSGDIVWKKTISLPNSLKADDYYYGPSVTSTADSGYIIAANSHNIVDGKNKSFVELLKLDSSGKVKWAKSIEAEKSIEINGAISQTSDGGFLVPGAKSYPSDPMVMKVDRAGRPLWVERFLFEPGRADGALAAAQTIDGGYVATGVIVDTQQPSAPAPKLPLFKFGKSGATSCNNFKRMNVRTANHKVTVSDLKLIVESPKITVHQYGLEEEDTKLTSSNCDVNWE